MPADELWAFDTTSYDWSMVCSACSGRVQTDASLVWDPDVNTAVMFEGATEANGRPAGTWQLDATSHWSQVSTTMPAGREDRGVAYDATTDMIVSYGGFTDPSPGCNGACVRRTAARARGAFSCRGPRRATSHRTSRRSAIAATTAIALAGLSIGGARVARADLSAVELQARGEDLAKAGRWAEAIDAFKAADRVEVRASHACLIALAYTRRELLPQAEVWLAMCRQRANAGDPLPEWVSEAERLLAERLSSIDVAPIEIVVGPAGVDAKLSVSSFAPDETFAPRTIHLPPGHHVIVARAAGYADGEHAIDVADKTPQHVAITLQKTSQALGPDIPSAPGHGLLLAGGIVAGAGVLTYAVMGLSATHEVAHRDGKGFGGGTETAYNVTRISTLGLWTVGAGLAIWPHLAPPRHRRSRDAVDLADPRRQRLVFEWQR